jgi:succinate dehydrogenase / fumarate reductase, membrane anchor subunit
MDRQQMRSPLGRAIGLGSAKEGADHWWAQRLSAVALVILGLWFVASVIALAGADRAAVVAWLHNPLAAILTLLLIGAVFYHVALGVQVVIEDYVHNDLVKIPSLVAMRLCCFALAVAGFFAVLRIAFGG